MVAERRWRATPASSPARRSTAIDASGRSRSGAAAGTSSAGALHRQSGRPGNRFQPRRLPQQPDHPAQSLKETTDSQRWEEPLQDRDNTNQRDQEFKQVSETPVANEPVDEIKAYCTDDDGD
jgi:hypothetical protein